MNGARSPWELVEIHSHNKKKPMEFADIKLFVWYVSNNKDSCL